ncbi:hypothetical protein [Pararhodobacter sp. SW119]|uniref:hypothetical protein n=1 Tax=Pararhodobacter sp. SW119 TaxID=2780075 RepID=UPI001ADFAC3D|nr:hypothetical protein [Pararhodobacter sp. SW119]
MPNAFAYMMLFSWPLVVAALFNAMPLQKALIWSIVAGYLLLPTQTGVNLPMVPTIDKTLVPSLSAALMCWVVSRRQALSAARRGACQISAESNLRVRGQWIISGLLLLLVATPIITVLQNADPVIAGPRFIPGLRLYDAISLAFGLVILFLPFLLAQRFLGTVEAHRYLLVIVVISALAYSLLVFFELRMSPQLHRWIYGFFPHSFAQHIRGDGFRPVVFLGHGLSVGIFLAMATLSACALWRQAIRERVAAMPWIFAAGWLLLTLLLTRNLGATALAMLFAPVILFTTLRLQLVLAAVIAGSVLVFPMLRGTGWVPTDTIHAAAQAINPERAVSLQFRFDHEDALLDRANERPLAGWGSWGRNRDYDPNTGRNLSVTDGLWVIVIGSYGWLGYIAQFGLMTLPILMLAFRRRTDLLPATTGLVLIATIGLINLIPNAAQTPVLLMVCGALSGYCFSAQKTHKKNESSSPASLKYPFRDVGKRSLNSGSMAPALRHVRRPRGPTQPATLRTKP